MKLGQIISWEKWKTGVGHFRIKATNEKKTGKEPPFKKVIICCGPVNRIYKNIISNWTRHFDFALDKALMGKNQHPCLAIISVQFFSPLVMITMAPRESGWVLALKKLEFGWYSNLDEEELLSFQIKNY